MAKRFLQLSGHKARDARFSTLPVQYSTVHDIGERRSSPRMPRSTILHALRCTVLVSGSVENLASRVYERTAEECTGFLSSNFTIGKHIFFHERNQKSKSTTQTS